ncbi:UDP-3-O-acyl-N-acetylglucosamine deacetylase [Geochorda subterranea]|uniref:UDP-3-O-acyl-N-acetylglucosamine deacetylase n=1 Tax=Geochorda subterranea TaxID=3109564 RepID=A0ABZ1BPY2_9FIRM|nr:UDP-3-O-acyl-N-acetylglucosamine deacetylase [Limnochorda sp. LNt]WRP14859.1 UDP-3-O-acyl-N-acetylglucosamine deacetylase [Limnochorda sp. LNt]
MASTASDGRPRQRTLASAVTVQGIGLHTGIPAEVRLSPAPEDHGWTLVRTDVEPPAVIPVSVRHRVETPRCTALGLRGVTVMTVEHLLATLMALGVDNVRVEVRGPELPILDGSAAGWVEALDRAGLVEQAAPRRLRRLSRSIWVGDADRFAAAMPWRDLRVSFAFISDHPGLGDQFAELTVTPETFRREIAPARTVAFAAEVGRLRAQGVGLGGSLDNVLLVADDGPVGGFRLADEVARHKLLDLIGDLALAGPLAARVVAVRGNHALTARLVEAMEQVLEGTEGKEGTDAGHR